MKTKLIYLYPLLLCAYAVYSFSQTTPNLVISSNSTFWNFQQSMWNLGYHNRPLSTLFFILITSALFALYWLILDLIKRKQLKPKSLVIIFSLSIAALLPSYPALSNDVFNYIFNAKMVVEYKADPHIKTAMDFPSDPWLKYMHNIHTPAPYGRGWTLLSSIVYPLGQGHIQTTILLFRLLMLGFFLLGVRLIWQMTNKSLYQTAFFALNPLILIETVSTIHNDIVMMSTALLAVLLLNSSRTRKKILFSVLGLAILVISMSIKFVTIILPAAYILKWIVGKLATQISLSKITTIALTTPLITARSQRFLAWYLIWPLTFVVFTKDNKWLSTYFAASFAALISYSLILYYGDYTDSLLLFRSIILFGIPSIYIIGLIINRRNYK